MSSLAIVVSGIGRYLMDVDMFPVFLTADFSLASLAVREDSKDLGPRFRQNQPLAMWMGTLICCLSGVFLGNFLFGDPLIDILKENFLIGFLTLIWYLINYSPYDIAYKTLMFPPVILAASALQELLRVRFIYLGLLQATKVYPGAPLIALIGGIIKGNGYGFIKVVEQLIRGKWNPTTNEILQMTYFAKSALYASVCFLLHQMNVLPVPIEFLYLGLCAMFVVCRMLVTIRGVKNPFQFMEQPVCALLFGSSYGSSEPKVDATQKKKN